jgi:hypothetical protein
MKFVDLYFLIKADTDVDIVRGCCKLMTIKRGTFYEDVPYNVREAAVKGITAIDYRTIEAQIGGKAK